MHKWDAVDYRNNSRAQLTWGRELIAKLRLKGNERVLDIGCGDGKLTSEIAAAVMHGTVTGIDNSPEMINLAKESFPPERYPRLRFILMDAESLEFEREFDVVFSNAALHWVKNHHKVLAGIHRTLRSPGRMLLQMGGTGNASSLMKFALDTINQPKWQPYFKGFEIPYHFYDTEEYCSWLSELGFKVERVELMPRDMTQQGKDGLMAWFRTTWHPFMQQLPENLRPSFASHIINSYLHEYPPDKNNTVHVAMVRLEVEAVKL